MFKVQIGFNHVEHSPLTASWRAGFCISKSTWWRRHCSKIPEHNVWWNLTYIFWHIKVTNILDSRLQNVPGLKWFGEPVHWYLEKSMAMDAISTKQKLQNWGQTEGSQTSEKSFPVFSQKCWCSLCQEGCQNSVHDWPSPPHCHGFALSQSSRIQLFRWSSTPAMRIFIISANSFHISHPPGQSPDQSCDDCSPVEEKWEKPESHQAVFFYTRNFLVIIIACGGWFFTIMHTACAMLHAFMIVLWVGKIHNFLITWVLHNFINQMSILCDHLIRRHF